MPHYRDSPDFLAFHRSLSEELYSLKDRIRNLVYHWPTDGEWKESALRSILRRHLPDSVCIGRGFIVTPNQGSTQIDILLIDGNRPTLFRDGDLFIVTPDVVLGAIEVKTSLRGVSQVRDALLKLSAVEKICRSVDQSNTRPSRPTVAPWTPALPSPIINQATLRPRRPGDTSLNTVLRRIIDNQTTSIWTGLFIYDDYGDGETLLEGLAAATESHRYPVRCISLGGSTFVRFWEQGIDCDSPEPGPVWHAYHLDRIAPSYFIGNLIDSITSVDQLSTGYAWFPMVGGKEVRLTHYLPLFAAAPLSA
jgi:hypothetical protein